ncbi:alpha-1A adrenergic receptor-like [Schistocerca nitens]|uniref:alpha-1A adrenergic receptor-like n=1 Tax=Schistocerca nitens TaxID=7011 RepID=UPI002117A904|nr:alpha-1A adrenergic receptor-like [Schistocerca nitens]
MTQKDNELALGPHQAAITANKLAGVGRSREQTVEQLENFLKGQPPSITPESSELTVRRNALLVSVALADLLVTGLVMPASSVVILAGLPDAPAVCRLQWAVAALSCLVTVLSLAAAACENNARLCLPRERHARLCTRARVTAAVLSIWAAAVGAVALQTALDAAPLYCRPPRPGPRPPGPGALPYHVACGALLLLLAFAWHARTALRVRALRSRPSFKPAVTFAWDYALAKTNAYSAALFVVFWAPFGVALVVSAARGGRGVPAKLVYNLAWFALSKSCVNSLLYCCTNRHFRNAYVNLFHYCCCKTTVSFSRRQRAAGAAVVGGALGDAARPSGDVRVHIIPGYNMYSYTSPQRARELCKTASGIKRSAGSCRPGGSGAGRTNGRDVYEL